jgi:hypothetical protein
LYVQCQSQAYNIGFEFLTNHRLEEIAPPYHDLVRHLALAHSMLMLSKVRRKYPIASPHGATIELDGAALESEGQTLLDSRTEDLKLISRPIPFIRG